MLTTAHEADFADGRYLFDLKLPQLAELQDKRGPFFEVYRRVCGGCYFEGGRLIINLDENAAHTDDLFEVIRLALIGGGKGFVAGRDVEVSPLLARNLVERYCYDAPTIGNLQLAATIMVGRAKGFEPPKKAVPPVAAAPHKASTSRKSSPRAKRSGSHGKRSHGGNTAP